MRLPHVRVRLSIFQHCHVGPRLNALFRPGAPHPRMYPSRRLRHVDVDAVMQEHVGIEISCQTADAVADD